MGKESSSKSSAGKLDICMKKIYFNLSSQYIQKVTQKLL